MAQFLLGPDSIIVERIGWTIVHSMWQIAIVAAIVAVSTVVLARQRANVRYSVLCAGMLACIAIPAGTFVAMDLPSRPATPAADPSVNDASPKDDSPKSVVGTRGPSEGSLGLEAIGVSSMQLQSMEGGTSLSSESGRFTMPDSAESGIVNAELVSGDYSAVSMLRRAWIALDSWMPAIFWVWIVGVVILALRPLFAIIFSRRVRYFGRSGVPQSVAKLMAEVCHQFHLTGAIEIAQSTLVEIPCVIGYFKPLVLLPASAITGLTETQLRTILLHELAHIKRHDYLVNLLQTAIESLLFYHPLTWWMSLQIRVERENCCDDIVLQQCGSGSEYVRALVQLESGNERSPILALNATGGSLVRRVRRIAGKQDSRIANAWIAGVIVLMLLALIPISQSTSIWAEQSEQRPETASASDSTPIRSGVIRVRVIDEAGEPVPNAEVKRRIGGEQITEPTDAFGVAELPVPVEPPELLSIHASGGFVPLKVRWNNSNKNDPNPIPAEFTFHVATGRKLSGRIMDVHGNSVVGAKITSVSAYYENSPINGRQQTDWTGWEWLTDENGQWSIDHVPMRLTRFDAQVSHPDFANDSIMAKTASGKMDLLTMQPGVTVRGTITDPAGNPLPNTQVLLTSKYSIAGSWMTRTNGLGEYEFDRVNSDEVGLTVLHRAYAPQAEKLRALNGPQTVDVQLQPGAPVRFRFVDENGEPVEGVRVTCKHWTQGRGIAEFEDVIPEFSDSSGHWVWRNAPNSRVSYDFTRRDCLSSRFVSREPQDEPYEHVIHPVLEISGRVTSKVTSEPIPDFKVYRGNWASYGGFSGPRVTDEDGGIRWDHRSFRSMKNGQYRYRVNEARSKHYIKIEAPGYKPAVSRAFTNSDGKLAFDFQLEEGSDLAGTIVDQTGKAISSAEVFYVFPGRLNEIRDSTPDQYGSPILTVSDSTGSFALPKQEQRCRIMVMADEGYAYVHEDDIKVKPEIRIEPWATIRGKCMIGARPAAGEKVWLHNLREPDYEDVSFGCTSTVKEDGTYEFTRVPPDVNCTLGRMVRRETKFGGTMIQNTHSHQIKTESGTVVDVSIGGNGRPLIGKLRLPAGAQRTVDDWNNSPITLSRVSKPNGEYVVDSYAFSIREDGTFRVEDLPAGNYQLTVIAFDIQAGTSIGRVDEKFTIPEIEGGRSDQPFDLGALEVKLK